MGKTIHTHGFLEALKHMTLFSYVVLTGVTVVWFTKYSFVWKIAGFATASTFSVLEFVFTAITEETKDGSLKFCISKPHFGHTTPEQWVANVLFAPLALVVRAMFGSAILTVLLAPLVIWGLELLEGYFLILLFGYNRAWYYGGKSAYCHGNIDLQFWWIWCLMGAGLETVCLPFLAYLEGVPLIV